jgi:thioredoxin-related protein
MRKMMFTTKTCPNCIPAKEAVANIEDIEILDAHENIELAQEFGIRAVPSLVVVDDRNKIKEVYVGAEDISEYVSKLK